MNVSLTPELEAMIREKVDSGRYASASEVVREALRTLETREEKLNRLRAEIQIGLDQLDRGEWIEYTPALMKKLMAEAREDSRQGQPIRDVVKP